MLLFTVIYWDCTVALNTVQCQGLKMNLQNKFTVIAPLRALYKRGRVRPEVIKVQPYGGQIQNCQTTQCTRQGLCAIS